MKHDEMKQEPVAWQWLTTAHFRKKLPKDAEKGAWNPLYTTPQPKQEQDEPVAVVDSTISGHINWLCTFFPKQGTKLYTTPQQRKPLTDEQIEQIENGIWRPEFFDDVERQANREFARAIEAAHGIKE